MIDTHAHLDFEIFDADRDETIARFFDDGGQAIINIGVDRERNNKSLEIASANPNVFSSVGFHPEEGGEKGVSPEEATKELEKLLKENDKIVAIGEIGLDYFHNSENREQQKKLFEAQLEIAKQNNLPVVVHCRDAYEDLYDILKEWSKNENSRFVIHCYMGNVSETNKFLELSCVMFSFTGNITFSLFEKYQQKKLSDEKSVIFKVVEKIPLERIMVETDCPFLAPDPFRGKRNEPAYVKKVIEKIAQIKGITADEVEQKTDQNAKEFFKLPIINENSH